MQPINGKISSSLEDLNTLNAIYPWLPNAATIRPSPEVLLRKQCAMAEVMYEWHTVWDYILYTVFGAQQRINAFGKREVVPHSFLKEWAFQPSLFPYALPNGTNHYILWSVYKTYSDDIDDEEINGRIKNSLQGSLSHSNFEFAWYKNPKPTVPQFWHVQVFWRLL